VAGIGLDVRRLAAVDMHGLKGSRLRARLIRAEFVVGAVLGVFLGVLLLAAGTSPAVRLFGLWVLGAGLNYIPLTLHAFSLSRPGALAEELGDADVRRELQHYTVAQLWVFVPLALVVFDLRQRRSAERPSP
jgi:hypothetical protein